jgi:hypothetical protein
MDDLQRPWSIFREVEISERALAAISDKADLLPAPDASLLHFHDLGELERDVGVVAGDGFGLGVNDSTFTVSLSNPPPS